jgi:hypothetical protein
MRVTGPISIRLGAARPFTAPLLPDDCVGYLNPRWSGCEPRGVVNGVLPETADAGSVCLRTPAGWPADTSAQYWDVDVDAVRHRRTYSLSSRRRDRIVRTCWWAAAGAVEIEL